MHNPCDWSTVTFQITNQLNIHSTFGYKTNANVSFSFSFFFYVNLAQKMAEACLAAFTGLYHYIGLKQSSPMLEWF